MADFDLITVEVAYALPHKQKIIALLVEPGTTALQAVERSEMVKFFPEIDVGFVLHDLKLELSPKDTFFSN